MASFVRRRIGTPLHGHATPGGKRLGWLTYQTPLKNARISPVRAVRRGYLSGRLEADTTLESEYIYYLHFWGG